MRNISLILFVLTAAIFFVLGYNLGQSNPLAGTIQVEPVAAEAAPAPVENKVAEIEAPLEPEIEPANPDEAYALRAAQPVITFTDMQGRKLVAKVLEVQADSLKVRRQSDLLTLPLPVATLCEADQAFAAYLVKVTAAKATRSQSMEDKIWNELFR